MRSPEARHTLLATGAAAGLSAAFNAPLAGILFIIEEMRPQFRYNLISIKAVFTGVIMATIVFRIFNGDKAVIEVGKLSNAPVNTLWLYLILGMIFGCVGPLFNTLVLRTQDMFQRIHGGNIKKWVLIGGLIGTAIGYLLARVLCVSVFERAIGFNWLLGVASLLLSVLIAVIASIPPVRRATRIDPAIVLREE